MFCGPYQRSMCSARCSRETAPTDSKSPAISQASGCSPYDAALISCPARCAGWSCARRISEQITVRSRSISRSSSSECCTLSASTSIASGSRS